MNVTNTLFTHTSTYGSSSLQINSGGHLIASGSRFAWSSMVLASGSVLNAGDLTNNIFDSPLYVPATDVAAAGQ